MPRSIAWSVAAVKEENAKREVLLRDKQCQKVEVELLNLRRNLKYAEERLEELSNQRRALEEP